MKGKWDREVLKVEAIHRPGIPGRCKMIFECGHESHSMFMAKVGEIKICHTCRVMDDPDSDTPIPSDRDPKSASDELREATAKLIAAKKILEKP